MTPSRFYVLSDLHITVPSPWTAFRDHAELGACLEHLAGLQNHTVILAGDTFDFLMLDDYEGFDARKSEERMAAILDAPANAPIVAGLQEIIKNGNRLVLLAGNHDPEVLQTSVRKLFAERVGTTELGLGTDVLLYEPENGKPALYGWRIDAGERYGFVMHGDRWDVSNFIDRGAFRRAAEAGEKIDLPPGSRLVYRIIRKLKPERRDWVDQVKPEIESVVPLLLYLDWSQSWEVLKKDWRLSANLLAGFLRAKTGRVNLGATASLPTGPQLPEDLREFVAALREAMPEEERESLLRTLAGAEVLPPPPDPRPGVAALAEHTGFRRWLLRAFLQRSRRRSQFFVEDAEDEISELLAPSLPPGINLLVAGHTHGQRWLAGAGRIPPLYVNSGTWTPVGPLPEGDLEDVIDVLARGELLTAKSPRTLVEIEAGSDLVARLRTWREGELV